MLLSQYQVLSIDMHFSGIYRSFRLLLPMYTVISILLGIIDCLVLIALNSQACTRRHQCVTGKMLKLHFPPDDIGTYSFGLWNLSLLNLG